MVEVVAADGRDDDDLLRIAAALGDRGGHVLGRAIARHAAVAAAGRARGRRLPGRPRAWGPSGRVDAVEYHIGSHRYLDESGLCPPDFHARLRPRRATARRHVGRPVGRDRPAGLDPPGRPAPARGRPRPGRAARPWASQTVMLTGDNGPTAAAVAVGARHRRPPLRPPARRQGRAPSPTSTPAAARPAWSATASTTPPPWPPPASASRSAASAAPRPSSRRHRPDGRRPRRPSPGSSATAARRSPASARTSRSPWPPRPSSWSSPSSASPTSGWPSPPTSGRACSSPRMP